MGDISTEEVESCTWYSPTRLSGPVCADALQNNYFKEDLETFPTVGSHNLYRATTQFRLSQSVHRQLSQAQHIVQSR